MLITANVVYVLGQDKGYTVEYSSLPEGVPEVGQYIILKHHCDNDFPISNYSVYSLVSVQ